MPIGRSMFHLVWAVVMLLCACPGLDAQNTIGVTPTSLSYAYQIGGSVPAPQAIAVGGTTGLVMIATAATTAGGNWLSVSPLSDATPVTLTVFVTPTGLSTGTYTGSITVSSAAAVNSPQVVPVTLTVSALPVLAASPAGLTFNVAAGGAAPAAQNLTVGTGPVFLGISAAASTVTGGAWLSVSPTTGTTPVTLAVSVNPAGLASGTYTGSIVIAAAGAGNSPLAVPVTLKIGEAAELKASPPSLSFSFQIGGPVPLNQAVALTNPGAPLAFALSATTTGGGNWLTASSPTTSTPATISAGVNPAGLSAGTYTGSVTVTAPGATNTPFSIPVTLVVSTDPVLALSPTSLAFNFQIGGQTPARQAVLVSNFGASLTVTATAATSSGGNWLSVAPSAASTPAALMVGVNPAGLAPGTFTGTITLTAPAAANSPVTLPVSLTVSATPLLNVSPRTLAFYFQIGGTTPDSRTVPVASTGSAIGYTASASTTSGGTWLSVTPASGTAPGNLTVSVNPVGLAAGVYNGSISVLSAEAGSIPQVVLVTLTVSTSPLLVTNPSSLAFSYQTSATLPANQRVTVTSTGAAFSYSASTSTSSGGPWLVVAPTSASTGTELNAGVNTAGLAEGTYTGVIVISAVGVANSPQFVPVVFTISTVSNLIVGPGPLTFSQTVGGSAPAAQTITVASSGTILTFTAAPTTLSGGNWLSVNPTTGITPGSTSVTVNAAGLAAGSYTGSVIISAVGASNSPQVVPVTLNVRPAAALSVSPDRLDFAYQAGGPTPAAKTVAVSSTGEALSISAAASTSTGGNWLSVSPASGTTTVNLSVSVNPAGLAAGNYSGTIAVTSAGASNSPRTISVTLAVTALPPPSALAFRNGASFQPGAVAPGLVFTLGGNWLGPETPATLRVNPSTGLVENTLGGTRVLFDDLPAPLLYVSRNQINAVAPYALAGRLSTRLRVEHQGTRSDPIELQVVSSAPGIFTLNASGSGPGAVLNQDYSVNTPTNAAARESIVMIYATGEGQTTPGGADGAVTGSTLKRPLLPVSVKIGGQNAEVLYAGSAPGFVSGVLQVNARIPANVAPGTAVAVEITVGAATSQANVTLAVR